MGESLLQADNDNALFGFDEEIEEMVKKERTVRCQVIIDEYEAFFGTRRRFLPAEHFSHRRVHERPGDDWQSGEKGRPQLHSPLQRRAVYAPPRPPLFQASKPQYSMFLWAFLMAAGFGLVVGVFVFWDEFLKLKPVADLHDQIYGPKDVEVSAPFNAHHKVQPNMLFSTQIDPNDGQTN